MRTARACGSCYNALLQDWDALGMENGDARTRMPVGGALRSSAALLIGFGILMLGDGLQGTLLAVRAALEAFPTTVTGAIMSVFFAGFLAGSLYTPRIVERVGHIRAFAALASLASAAILIHAVFVSPLAWSALRLFSGFCFAGLYVVTESWLNARADNRNRGQLLSVYMVIAYLGTAVGQLLLNVADPLGFGLFILTSVLISVALVPLLLSASAAPGTGAPVPVNLRELFSISPLGVFGVVCSGMASAALFAMGPVYADAVGLSVAQISLFMTAGVTGCVVLQWPIGRLSDKYDRRQMLTLTTFLAAGAAMGAASVSSGSMLWLMVWTALFGGLSLPLYSLCIAHANDFLAPDQMVAASGGLVLANGIGSVLGPVSVSVAMSLHDDGFFWSLAGIHAMLGAFALYRMKCRPARPLAEQGQPTPTGLRSTQVLVAEELDEASPRTGTDAGR